MRMPVDTPTSLYQCTCCVEARPRIAKERRTKIRVASDCSGLGTEVLAFEGISALKAKVVHVFASEIEPSVRAIFRASHKHVERFYRDVTQRSGAGAPDSDIYVNTSPCQPFSAMGSGEPLRSTHMQSNYQWHCEHGRRCWQRYR